MVKVFAPALSLDASGTIGEAITFSKWKGRHYIRERIIPSNPKSGLQVGFRSMFKFLSQHWSDMLAARQADYDSLADSLAISPFNAYIRLQQRRWRLFKSPSEAWPAGEGDSVGLFAGGSAPAATGGVASIQIDFQLGTANQNQGLLIFKGSTGFSTAINNCIAAVKLDDLTAGSFLDSPLAAGTYYYNTRLFSDDGVLGAEDGEISAAAT